MQVFLGLKGQLAEKRPVVVSVGNFDGMHKGHQELIRQVQTHARRIKGASVVMTFDPHPMKVLFPQMGLKNIFDLTDRIEMLGQMNMDYLLVEPFSRELSQLSPEDFFSKLLVERLQMKVLYVGHDFSFGKNRAGTLELLKKLCDKYEVELHCLEPVRLKSEVVSSTKIREAIVQGDAAKVHSYLGRPFYLQGVVEKGLGRGRQIGFPTANLFTRAELFPKTGVYVTKTKVDGKIWESVTNVGHNPTFKEQRPLQVETHILDFDKDIYGEFMQVFFYDYIRPELRFNSVQELVSQIKEDIKRTRAHPWKQN